MMPGSFIGWAMFAFFLIGALGGWWVILLELRDRARRRR